MFANQISVYEVAELNKLPSSRKFRLLSQHAFGENDISVQYNFEKSFGCLNDDDEQ